MSLKPVNDILKVLVREQKWHLSPLLILLQSWEELVGTAISCQTRPVSIQRDVLWVATSSSVWAQNLTFGRQKLMGKLNEKLPKPLVDIRFSTAEWERVKQEKQSEPISSPQAHPSYLGEQMNVADSHQSQDVHLAFADWARVMRSRSHNLPLCPHCQCPTPPGELDRWSVCSPCAAKQLSGNGES